MVVDMISLLVGLADQAPEPEDVKAGWTAFALFIAGLVAVGLLGWSLVRQLRKVEDARKRGVYGDEPETEPQDAPVGGDAVVPGEPGEGAPEDRQA